MKFSMKNFRKAISLICAVAIIVSTVFVMSVSATAATISNDENVFTSLTIEETETYQFEGTSNSTGYISEGNGKQLPGIASGLNGGGKIYNRIVTRGTSDNSTYAMKWSSAATLKSGFILGKTGTNVGNGVDQAYVLEDNTTYEVSYDYYNHSGTALTLNVIGVNAAKDEVLTDADDSYTYTVFDDVAIDGDSASKKWTTYTCTFTTGTVGDNKYLSFAVFRNVTTAFEFWLDNFKISKVTTLDTNDLITFNDNGKTYYAYPDALATLPEGDNGALGSEFLGWYDADGNEVTEIPAAGTVLTAKYPIISELPILENTVTLPMDSPAANKNITTGNSNGVYGVVSSTHSTGTVYYRSYSSDWGVKIINSDGSKGSTGIMLGKEDVAYDSAGSDTNRPNCAYALKANTKYTVSFDYALWASSSSVAFQIVAAEKSTQSYYNAGIVLDTYIEHVTSGTAATDDMGTADDTTDDEIYYVSTANGAFKTHTATFTTPADLGSNVYLMIGCRSVNNSGEIADGRQYTVQLDDAVITEYSQDSAANYITLVDGEDVYYTTPDAISALPEGQSAAEGESFLGWYDGNGNKVTSVPTEVGTVLTANYGVIRTGLIMASVRLEESPEVNKYGVYQSAGVRFRGRLSTDIVDSASEIGFVLVPTGNAVDSSAAIKGVNKSDTKHVIYDDSNDGYIDYQVILTGLTREGQTSNLCNLSIDVYFYYIIDGVTTYCGDAYTTSYNEIVAVYEADLPLVNNTVSSITSAETGDAATDTLTEEALSLTPPAYTTVLGSTSYVDATDDTTLMTVSNTSKTEYETYLASLEAKGYTAVVGNSRILSSSPSYSAIYSDGTNLINVAYIDAYNEVKVTIEPTGCDTVEDVNDYLSVFHEASSAEPETAVCDPLFLTVGLSGSEDNSDEDFYAGMGYIYRLADGSFVIIDGGSDSDVFDHAGKIYSMLKYYAPDPENIVISAWIMTHAHSDHMYVFKSFVPKYVADETYNVTLQRVITNLPNEAWVAGSGMPETNLAPFRTLFAECEARGTAIYKAHVGQVYNLPGFTTEILYTLEQTAPAVENKSMSNTSSIIFRSVIEDKSFLFTADATSTSVTYVNDAFGKKMKSDFIQTPHHGTCSNFTTDAALAELTEFYNDNVKADYVLWSAAEAGMNYYLSESNPNSVYGNSVPYANNISLGHNIKSIKLNSDTIEVNAVDYYEIGYLKSEPIAISTEAEFKAIGEDLTGYYYLTNDITITETVTTPYWGSAFKGYLDGKGYTVTFANAVDHACAASQSGILCTTVQGVIRNISFGSATAPIKINYSATASGAMGLFGSTRSNITFDNVKVYSDIAYTVSGGTGNYVGGFLGRIYRSSSNTASIVVFKNCEFNGTYTENANTSGNLKAFGGLVGGQTDLNMLTVTDCAVNVTADAKCSTANSGVGGIVGRLQHTYGTVISNTSVSGSISGRSFVGGMIGTVQPSTGTVVIENCTNNATLSGGTTGDMCGNAGTITTIISTAE